ncbi:lipopolysaccharide biosynthesis protein [Streptomyces bungoensis]|uniref:Lipopolysaccharide biosynthesis protein n=1 Tax=Streptomyces bungoensis TaxID=285568 RepID=A0A101T048_9ACTN|nr:lipopolysaccharide biosynthesis protein [Streptomyces bungoensis]KUN83357.1 lipopolysaccharide biosynthesis protein [Streptomyces bungoensis]
MTDDHPTEPVRPPRRSRWRAVLRWLLVPSGVLLGASAGAAYGVMTPPQYTATSYVIAVPADKAAPDSAATLGFAQTYGRVATQLAVLGRAQDAAGVPVRTLRRSVRAETSPDAPMIAISATSRRRGRATAIADAVSRALTTQAERAKRSTGVSLVLLSRAVPPTEPSSPSTVLTALVGASAGGLLGGLGLLARPRRAPADDDRARAQVPVQAPAAEPQGVR